jgi:SNF2 family DNA or RNA helicase
MASAIETMMLRRRKAQVRAELPPVIVQDLHLELSDQQRTAYDEVWYNRLTTLRQTTVDDAGAILLGLITELKILCNYDRLTNASSKLEALRSLFEGAGESARILVFSQFVETLNWISGRIGIPFDLLTGSCSVEEREEAVQKFMVGQTPRALLISLRAGGVGLNLGEATHVVLFDRWWNPAVEVQAMYRAHRFDRADPLHVIRFLVQDSIEERIAIVLSRKEALFEKVVDSVVTGGTHFSREELIQILDLMPEDLPHQSLSSKGE